MSRNDLVVTPSGARYRGRMFPCTIGRGGITTNKHEGDGATPSGVHRVTGCLYRPDRMAAPNSWAAPLRPGDCWSDDSADPDYNQLVRAPHGFSHEKLRRADPLYDLILLTDWNWPDADAGKGSAIFIHQWRKPGHPTAGCVAFAPEKLRWIAAQVSPGTRVLVA
ncbi:MAG: L,D-transpeptidase family protein [Paracoccaceae bacterium]